MASETRIQLEKYLKTLNINANKVIDIGGSQNSIQGRTKVWNVKEYNILDLEQPHELQMTPDIICDIQETDKKKTPIHNPLNYEQYDVAFCIEVAEYWHSPLTALRNINGFLKEYGTLFISFHFLYPHHNPEGEDKLRYTRWGVEYLLHEAGFDIQEIKVRKFKFSGMVKNLYQDEGMRGLDKNQNPIHDEQGWIIKAIKK